MRKNSFFGVIVLLLFALINLNSCSKKPKSVKELENEVLPQPSMTISQGDTAEVKQLVEHFLMLLQNNQTEDAIGMLHYLHHDKIVPLPESMANAQRVMFKKVKGVRYEIDGIVFQSEIDSQVKYSVILFDKKPDDPRPNKVSFVIKPVRREGKWYLTMANSKTDSNHLNGSRIQN